FKTRRLPATLWLCAAALLAASSARADTLTVANTLDKGAGSLRNTVTKAKSGDTIIFAPALAGQTITLTSDELEIGKNLDIEGLGANLLTISGNDANRIFHIEKGASVTIAGLAITHGLGRWPPGAGEDYAGGGGILNRGSLS